VWQSETLDNNQVKRETQTFPMVDDFSSNLVTRALDKSAYIEIAGMWDHASAPDTDAKRNEGLLKAIRDKGYEEAGFANLKKYYGPEGHHFIDTIRADADGVSAPLGLPALVCLAVCRISSGSHSVAQRDR